MPVLRMCAVCRKRLEKCYLIRIARNSDGKVCIDRDKKLQSRGMYICRDEKCINAAEKRRVIERALRCSDVKDVYGELRDGQGM